MLGVVGRSLVAYILATVLLRLVGRKSVSQLNYLDFIMANTMGGLMGYFIAEPVKGAKILLGPAVITAAGVLTEKVVLKNRPLRKLLEGQPLILIKNGQILEKNMAAARFNIGELLMALRRKGVFNPSEVEFAVLETSGMVSVQKKSQNRPATPKDMRIPTNYEGLSSVLVSNGRVMEKNLKRNRLDRLWLENELTNKGIKEVKNVFLAMLGTDGSVYLDLKKDKVSPTYFSGS